MKKVNKMKTISLDDMIDKHVGKIGTPKRDSFEYELSIDLIGYAIKQARKEFPCVWTTNYSSGEKKTTCYWDIILKDKYNAKYYNV